MKFITQGITLFLCFLVGLCYAQLRKDSLEQALPAANDRQRIDILHELTYELWLNYTQLAMEYAEESLKLSQSIGDSTLISKSLRMIAGVYYYKGELDSCLTYNIQALAIAHSQADSVLIGNGLNNIGLLYLNLGSYQPALEYLLRSYTIKIANKDSSRLASTLNNVGLVFEQVKNFKKSREYYRQALKIAQLQNDKNQIVYSYNNIGSTYFWEDDLDSSFFYFSNGQKLAKSINNVNWGAVAERGLAQIKIKEGRGVEAEVHLKTAYEYSEQIDDKKGISEYWALMGKIKLAMGSLDSAEIYLQKSQVLALKLKYHMQITANYQSFITLYKRMQAFEKAFAIQDEYETYRDNVFTTAMVRNLEMVPETLAAEVAKIDVVRKEQQLQLSNYLIKLFAALIFISIPIIIWLYVLVRNNRRIARVLSEKNKQLAQAQKMLVTSEKMVSLGTLTSGLAHELNNPLNYIQNGARILRDKINETSSTDQNEINSLIKIIESGIDRASRILKSLSYFSMSGDSREKCNLHEILDNCITVTHPLWEGKIKIHKNWGRTRHELLANPSKLHQAFLNIITNAIQAIPDEGEILINTSFTRAHVTISIADSGMGIHADDIKRIADPFFTTKATGTATGLGLYVTYQIINELGGNVEIDSELKKGTVVTVQLPLST